MADALRGDSATPPMDDDTFARLTQAVRDADVAHQSSGGGTRHWLRECFLPSLAEQGLSVVATTTDDEASG